MTARSRESVMSSLRTEWAQQETRMRNEHQVNKIEIKPDNDFNKNCIDDLCFQEHAQGLLAEIEELLMTNKLLSMEKEEQKVALEEGRSGSRGHNAKTICKIKLHSGRQHEIES